MLIQVDQQVPVFESYAAERTRGLYNVAPADGQRFQLDVELPLDARDWQIGMIVGPSGSGKSSVVRKLADAGFQEWEADWPSDAPVIETLTTQGTYAKATAALAAVGLGSVPSWLRPHPVLSTGEKFRADMAQLLLSGHRAAVLDEFTSVLDRQVAKIGAGAFAKSWRRGKDRQIILVTCHYDVLEWVQPDWWVDTAEGLDEFAAERGVVKAREGSFQATNDRARYRGDRMGALEV